MKFLYLKKNEENITVITFERQLLIFSVLHLLSVGLGAAAHVIHEQVVTIFSSFPLS